jgi:AcrR family transcriptional regulator
MSYGSAMSDALTAPTRKDAARNRARLLEAAQDLFCTQTDVTLKDVARHAGVGVGTVYRHFPTKEDLLDALSSDRLDDAAEIARKAAADPDGWHGLVQFLDESMQLQAQNGCLRGLLGAGEPFSPSVGRTRETITELVHQVVAKAQEQGTLKPGIDAAHITYLQLALVTVLDATRDTAPEMYRQHLALFLDGMHADNG